jgi:hypothetical protein
MAWGLNANVNLAYVNQYVGARLQQLRQCLEDLNDFNTNALVPNGGATYLTGLGMTSGDATQMIACIGDMVELYQVYYGNAYIASGGVITNSVGNGHNFDLNTKLGAGISVHG